MGMEMVIFNESPPFTLPYEPFGRKGEGKRGVAWGVDRQRRRRVGQRELAGKRGGEESAVLLIRAAL